MEVAEVHNSMEPTDTGTPSTAKNKLRTRVSRRRVIIYGWRLAIAAVALGLWQLASGRVVSPFWIGRPSTIADVLRSWTVDGSLFTQLRPTLTETVLGFALGGVIGAGTGFVLGYLRPIGDVLNPFITAIYALPKIALAPLILLWFGIGSTSKVVFAALLVFFLVFFNTYSGVRHVDPDYMDAVRLMGARRRELVRYVVWPNAASWIFLGLRVALPYALIGAVVGEMFASNQGIGYLIMRAANEFNTNGVFAALFVLMIVGTLLNAAVAVVEGRVQRWQPQNLREAENT